MRRLILALALAAGVATTAVSVPSVSAAPETQVLAPVAPSGPWQPFATPLGPAWALFDLTGRLVMVVPATVLPPAPPPTAALGFLATVAPATFAAPYAYPSTWPNPSVSGAATSTYSAQPCTCAQSQ